VIVLDPPRVGAAGLLTKLVTAKPKRIVYVSCDPATLGRDLGEALARGYRVDRVACVEMFPHTADLETVVRLVPV
jgi:23S rRNA (uracil1939-C5)-methyltransferase